MKFFLLAVLFLVVICFSSAATSVPRKLTKSDLQNNYVSSLLKYEQMPYAPYGETDGISCSTLVRKALIETSGIDKDEQTAIKISPCASNELREGCSGQLTPVTEAKGLEFLDYSKLQSGDVAIIGNEVGLHTMAYIGDKTWIHADPITEKVSRVNRDDDDHTDDDWFKFKVLVMRWKVLTE